MYYSECNQLFLYWQEEIKKLGYSFIPLLNHIELMESTKTLGYCRYNIKNNSKYNGVIRINRYLLQNGTKEEINRVIIHELIHAINLPNNLHHNTVWKQLAEYIGNKLGYKITRLTSTISNKTTKPKETVKYKVQCPSCNHIWNYRRLTECVKFPNQYRCSTCKCNLKRIL